MKREEVKQIFDDHLKSLDCLNNDVEMAMYLRLIDAAELIVKKCPIPDVSNGRVAELEEENTKLRFCIEHGIGECDLENDDC